MSEIAVRPLFTSYDPSNEPDFHVSYLYVYAGAPSKIQQRIRDLTQSTFNAEPDGLPGNDDAGATSAWYVLSAAGIYPVSPGDLIYVIGSPVFDRTVIHRTDTITADRLMLSRPGTVRRKMFTSRRPR